MPCANPLTAYRPANGGPVSFKRPIHGQAGEDYFKFAIPCGQCILCRLEHARQWAVRITHEATEHLENAFVTLTYDDAHLPQYGSLNYEHLQKFWKRLRKRIGELRYYAVGEYGDQTQRPHYHACIFGHAFTLNRTILRETPNLLWTSPMLMEAWGLGNVSVGALNFVTAQYTASYVTKKLNNKQKYVRVDEETGELLELVQPRAFMSLKPAIGRTWLEQYGHQVYDHDQVVIQGRPQKPPKYYDRWLEKENKEKREEIKTQRIAKAKIETSEQTRTRARNAHARAKSKKKSV